MLSEKPLRLPLRCLPPCLLAPTSRAASTRPGHRVPPPPGHSPVARFRSYVNAGPAGDSGLAVPQAKPKDTTGMRPFTVPCRRLKPEWLERWPIRPLSSGHWAPWKGSQTMHGKWGHTGTLNRPQMAWASRKEPPETVASARPARPVAAARRAHTACAAACTASQK